ncbi:YtxH domain-containing protein [Paenibacillus cremeus]|uniref:YtxH domain-containing protein n=1 Tax=Paenibacillus cremeus TaxID=2163881 RepID=A0A559K3J2_9BACL|nr:YtxH domain-containing protein [Paenibacillus cremeus]TVY06699.1 YtxH domain-containing protein [Paenibacillus cremeus]
MANKRGKDLLVGAVVGTVLGAVTALLFAPKSGRELRADISEGVQNISEKTQQIAGDVTEKSKQLATDVIEKTQAAAETIGRHTSEWAGKAKDAAVHVSNEVKSWRQKELAEDEVAVAEASVAATTVEQEEQ